MNSSAKKPEAPITAVGSIAVPVADEHNPYEALDDLMVVVEALCPTWPPRPAFGSGQYKL